MTIGGGWGLGDGRGELVGEGGGILRGGTGCDGGGGAVWAAVGLAGSKSPFPIPFDPLGPLRTAFSGSKLCFLSPQAFFCGALWIKIVIFNPVCPSWPPSRASSGLKTLHSEPAALQNLIPWLKIAISNPVCLC